MCNVEKVTEQGDDVRLLLTKTLCHKGDTLNSRELFHINNASLSPYARETATITAVISSPALDVIGVQYTHW
jgi:hypothetical protein